MLVFLLAFTLLLLASSVMGSEVTGEVICFQSFVSSSEGEIELELELSESLEPPLALTT